MLADPVFVRRRPAARLGDQVDTAEAGPLGDVLVGVEQRRAPRRAEARVADSHLLGTVTRGLDGHFVAPGLLLRQQLVVDVPPDHVGRATAGDDAVLPSLVLERPDLVGGHATTLRKRKNGYTVPGSRTI